jgi:hypothetical protein
MAKRHRNQHRPSPTAATTQPAGAAGPRAGDLPGAIRAGLLDDQLPALIDAINYRSRLVAEQRARQALSKLSVGARVRLRSSVRPRYLQGQYGEVHEIDGRYAIVCLDRPVGRFTDGHVRCPPLSLELVEEART